jgi:Activator of Hsp90 ATPase homolog 1-like protein
MNAKWRGLSWNCSSSWMRRGSGSSERSQSMLSWRDGGPHGYTTPEIDLDLRVGGGYRFTMQPPDGDRFHLAGEFLKIEPPSRLVYTFRWEEPDPDDRETVVTIGQECRPHTFR